MPRARGVATALFASLILLLVNSAYLAAFASPTLFYFANVVLHMVLGSVLGVVWLRHVYRHARPALRAEVEGEGTRPEGRAYERWAYAICAIVLGAGGLCGAAIMVIGAAGPTRWLLPAHIGLTVLGGAPLLARTAWVALRGPRSRQRTALGAAYALVLVAFAAAHGMATARESRAKAQYRFVNRE